MDKAEGYLFTLALSATQFNIKDMLLLFTIELTLDDKIVGQVCLCERDKRGIVLFNAETFCNCFSKSKIYCT